MANKNQKHENKQENVQPTPQPTTPEKPVELTDEELSQVVGGHHGGEGSRTSIQPNPTAVE